MSVREIMFSETKTKHETEFEHHESESIMLLENERRVESHEHVGEKTFDNM